MSRRIPAILRSRPAVLVLVMAFSASLVTLGVQLWPWIATKFARTEPLITPKIDGTQRAVRDHIESVREKLQSVLNDSKANPRQKGLAYGELGKIYLAYSFAEAAVPALRNAATFDPGHYPWPYLLAEALDQAGKTAEAAHAMELAVKLMQADRTSNTVDYQAALCFLGQAAMRLTKPAEASRTFQAVLDIAPDNLFALVKMAQLASQAGDSAAAIGFFERALQRAQGPNRLSASQLLAAEYARQGNAARAAELTATLPADARQLPAIRYPDPLIREVALLNRGVMLQNAQGIRQRESGRHQDALESFMRAVEADPRSEVSWTNLALTLLALGRPEEAQQRMEEVMRFGPGSDSSRSVLIMAYAASAATRGQALDAVLAWRREQPDSSVALRQHASVSMRLENYKDALNLYQEAAGRTPSETWPVVGLARALGALGRHADARTQYEKLWKANPHDTEAQLLFSRFLATSPDARVRDGSHSLEMSRPLMASLYSVVRAETVAVGLAEIGRFDDAIELQRKAVEMCGDQAEVTLRTRAQAVLRSLEARRPWRERMPFQTVKHN